VSAEEPKDVPRLREAFATLADEGSGEPVDSQRIFDALHGDLSPEERQAVVEQLLTNPAAAEAWRLAREMPPGTAVKPLQERDTGSGAAKWKWMSLAAAVTLTVGLGWQFMQPRGGDEPAYRSVESRAIASALAPGAELSRAQPVLRWNGVEGARYRVRVLTPDLQLLEESAESPARDHTVSAATLERIPPGGQLLWQVEARVPGEGVIVSPTFSNRVP